MNDARTEHLCNGSEPALAWLPLRGGD